MARRDKVFILALSILASLSLRILADAFYIPGHCDCTGVYFSATLLPLYWSILFAYTNSSST